MPPHPTPLKRKASKRSKTAPLLEDPPLASVALNDDADAFIDGEPQLRAVAEQITSDVDAFIDKSADIMSKATRKQHIKALMFAYSVWLKMGYNPAYQNFVARQRAKRKRTNKKTTALHLIVDAVVNYGEEDDDQRRLRSRDVAAIKYLFHKDLGPAMAEDLSTKLGEGLDKWSRDWPILKKQIAAGTSSISEPLPPQIAITIRMVDGEGNQTTERYNLGDSASTLHYVRALQAELRVRSSNNQRSESPVGTSSRVPTPTAGLRDPLAEC